MALSPLSGRTTRGGSIILLSSLAAHAAVGTLSAYPATKGAIDTLVKHFAASLGPRGIRVNAVAPGVVDTDMSSFVKTDDGQKAAVNMQALQRVATRGYRPGHRLPCVGRSPVDHRRHRASGRWFKAVRHS